MKCIFSQWKNTIYLFGSERLNSFLSKSTARGCQRSAVECLIENKKSESKKGHNSEKKKKHFELSPVIVWIALWIVSTYSDFQVNILCNYRDITKWQSFCMTTTATTPRLYPYLGFSSNTAKIRKKNNNKVFTPDQTLQLKLVSQYQMIPALWRGSFMHL